MISCYHLNIPHPRRDGALLDDVSFELEQGSWADITGESGCGKSVLFELLSLRLLTREGTLIVGGRNLDRLPRRKLESLRRRIGACAQKPSLLEDRTVLENLLLPLVARGETRRAAQQVEVVIEALELGALRNMPLEALTESERRVVAIGRACVGTPAMILIDGGVEGLDPAWKKRARSYLRKLHLEGSTVILFSREAVGPMTGRGVELRLEDGRVEPTERSLHAPAPEHIGVRR
ncbi:MAG: ATP-binding cassette domain-containing protein [Myxococcota bacterium]|nr:ATP-binding cassette domain-containing protein [Myxococcota bacterium]